MRKVILFVQVSLDGFFEGPKKEIDWNMVDDELHAHILEVPSLEAAIDLEARTQILALATEDAAEQRKAMGAKRPPDYKLR